MIGAPPRAVRASQGGGMTVELVVLTPVVVLFALVAIALGRYQSARQEVTDAAHAGAEAASVVAAPGQASASATDASTSALRQQPHMCQDPLVRTDTSSFVPGGFVRVNVSCQVQLSDLLVPGLPGTVHVEVTQSAPIDPFRVVR